MRKRYEIRCNEDVLDEYTSALRRILFNVFKSWALKYGVLLGLFFFVSLYYWGKNGQATVVFLIWLISVHMYLYMKVSNIPVKEMTRHITWGMDTMEITKWGVHYWRSEVPTFRVCYVLPMFDHCFAACSSIAFLFKKEKKHKSNTLIIAPTEAVDEVENLLKTGSKREAVESPGLSPSHTYRGERSPSIAERGIIPSVSLSNFWSYILIVLWSTLCMLGIEYLVPDACGTGVVLIVGTFYANMMLFLDWASRYDRTAVSLEYSLRKRAMIIRSSDGWLAVIPYAQIERTRMGKKFCLLETKNGHYIPCPPEVMNGQLKEVPRKTYYSGTMVATIMFPLTMAITFSLMMAVVFEVIDAIKSIMM